MSLSTASLAHLGLISNFQHTTFQQVLPLFEKPCSDWNLGKYKKRLGVNKLAFPPVFAGKNHWKSVVREKIVNDGHWPLTQSDKKGNGKKSFPEGWWYTMMYLIQILGRGKIQEMLQDYIPLTFLFSYLVSSAFFIVPLRKLKLSCTITYCHLFTINYSLSLPFNTIFPLLLNFNINININ